MHRKGFLLIFLSSILLGIWATVNTIALRNILLVFNAGLSIIYIREWLKVRDASLIKNHLRSTDFFCWLPSILIMAMFIWVIAHYLLFSQSPQKQWEELSSTWLRAFMASVIGFGCALALRRNQSFAWLLWLGLIVSFLLLTYQYIPKAINARSIFATDWYGDYIYWAKYSGVLAGTILFAGTLGLSIDSMRQLSTVSKIKRGISGKPNTIFLVFMIIFGLILPVYAFVFIFSAKNGVGVATLLLIFWFVVFSAYFLIGFIGRERHRHSNQGGILKLTIFLFSLSFFWFAYQHVKNNPGWESLIEDMQISAQINKFQNWKNPSKYGYPKRADGSSVASNTYERTALALVGLKLISNDPIGNGVLRSLPYQMQKGGFEYDFLLNYTHSAWIDLGLSYGWPGLIMLPTMLILCLITCIKKYRGPYRATVASLGFSLLVLYSVGEYAFQHGIEILLFISALLAGLILPTQKPISDPY